MELFLCQSAMVTSYSCLSKDGIIPLSKCNAGEHQSCDIPELHYRAMRVERSHGDETETIVLLANSINEKAQWLADLSQVGVVT